MPGTSEDREYLDNKIIEFNSQIVTCSQKEQFIHIDYVIKDNDKIVGGITTILYYRKCLYINVLWVKENYRHNGLGSKLLKKVEDEVKQQGCALIHLDTFDFQAPDFYLKHGYEIFGELENCPPGHKRFFLKKISYSNKVQPNKHL